MLQSIDYFFLFRNYLCLVGRLFDIYKKYFILWYWIYYNIAAARRSICQQQREMKCAVFIADVFESRRHFWRGKKLNQTHGRKTKRNSYYKSWLDGNTSISSAWSGCCPVWWKDRFLLYALIPWRWLKKILHCLFEMACRQIRSS